MPKDTLENAQDSRSNKRFTVMHRTRANGGDYEAVIVGRLLRTDSAVFPFCISTVY